MAFKAVKLDEVSRRFMSAGGKKRSRLSLEALHCLEIAG